MNEHALQVSVAHLLTVCLDLGDDPAFPRTWWSAIDHGVGKLSKRAGGMMKARGVKRGLPDIMIMTYGHHPPLIGIELKTDKGKLSSWQVEIGKVWSHMGFPVYVARSLEEVQEILEFCRIPMRNRMVFLGGGNGRPSRITPARHRGPSPARKSKNRLPVVQPRAAKEA